MKTKIPTLIVLLVFVPVAYVAWQFVLLYVGTRIANETSRELLESDQIIRAFAAYPESHKGRYPSFRRSQELTLELETFLAEESSKLDYEGHPYTTVSKLEATAKRAIWNGSLSGARKIDPYSSSPAWVFYLPRPDHRFVVAFGNGRVTIQNRIP